MKKLCILIVGVFMVTITVSCAEVQSINEKLGGIENIAGAVPSTPAAPLVGGSVDFRSGEVLCAHSDMEALKDNSFAVAKVLTAATPATKNQAQVLYVGDGKKQWTKYVIPTHRAAKSELILGKVAFYHSWRNAETMNADQYRKDDWYIGTITSTDELFKGKVDINGEKVNTKWVRIPNIPLTLE